MKQLMRLALLASLMAPWTAFAQKEKVVEASSREKPGWIGRSDASSICVTEVGETLAQASERCMASIREQIINSVAVNVSSAETMTRRQITRDKLMIVMSYYSSVMMTEAAKLPYLSDISLSNAEAIYWERIYSKQTKTYRYEYSVRYPFGEQTRRQLVDAFVAIDNAKCAEYERLRKEFDTLHNLDRIKQAVNELEGLEKYFFDATRRSDIATLRSNYLLLYDRISIRPESETCGACLFSLRLDGRKVTTSAPPRLKSESAVDMRVSPHADTLYLLTYDPQYAPAADMNRIEVLYLIANRRIGHTFSFDPSQDKVTVRPVGQVLLEQQGGVVRGSLRLRITGDATVQRICLSNPADGKRLSAERIEPRQPGAGERTVRFEMTGTAAAARSGIAAIRGTVTFVTADGKSSETAFILPYRLTINP